MRTITANSGTQEIPVTLEAQCSVSTQGSNANDFTWSVQKSLDGGTTWTAMKNAAGDTVFTGSDDFIFMPAGGVRYRVIVVAKNTTATIYVACN